MELLGARERSFRRTASRASLCADDAEDAFQRAVEILLRRGPLDADPAHLASWMHVVTRREALAVGRARRRSLGVGVARAQGGLEPDALPSGQAGPAAALEGRERAEAAAQRLGVLKPAERRALALQGAGCSYVEIQTITGWSYTKVNRCLAEGRAALRRLEPLAPPA